MFPGFDHEQLGVKPDCSQGLKACFAIGPSDVSVAHHEHATSLTNADIQHLLPECVEAAIADDHVVRGALKGNRDPAMGLSAGGSHG